MYRAFATRATEPERDNRPLLARILELRKEKARLLGFPDFADFVLHDRMAHKGEHAMKFLEDLKVKTDPFFAKENAALEAFAGQKLEPWDVGYWAEKQRRALTISMKSSCARTSRPSAWWTACSPLSSGSMASR